MKKFITILAGLVILTGRSWAAEPKWEEVSRGVLNVNVVLINQDNPKIIYLGLDKGIFKTRDGGGTWRNIFSLKGDNRALNYLAFGTQDKKAIYAATGSGLYFSANEGQGWSRVFKGKNAFENDCTAMAILPQGIYLGTKGGLFISKDKGRSWHKETGKLGGSQILNIACYYKEPAYIYVACLDGVFRSVDSGLTWERTFITLPVENSLEPEEENEDRDEQTRYSEIRYIAIDYNNTSNICLATSRGIYKSKNKGKEWELLSEYGLLSRNTQFLLFSAKSELYAVTKSGVFAYQNEKWRELSFNLSVRNINFLELDNNTNLYACTDKGLFKTELDYAGSFESPDIVSGYSQGEPGIKEVQEQAIKYAEVEPEKIINWRKQAAKKAFFPKVSANVGRNVTDLWHWESGSTTKSYDDVLMKGKDALEWDVSVSWDLSEVIWSDDQTNIDVRSRLMVELRDDILDEVNKLYFERLRVKMDLDSLQIEDRKKRFEKELRVRELTASLDALTGGYFSRQILYLKQKPENL